MTTCSTPPSSLSTLTTIHLITYHHQPSCPQWGISGWQTWQILILTSSISPVNPTLTWMCYPDCQRTPVNTWKIVLQKDAICATIQPAIHQGEDVTPWVIAVSESIDIVNAEPVITDLVFPHLTSEDICRAQWEDPDISRILANKKRGYPPSGENKKNRLEQHLVT